MAIDAVHDTRAIAYRILTHASAELDLDNYLPLGAWLFENVQLDESSSANLHYGWVELSYTQLPPYTKINCSRGDIELLIRAQWLRIFHSTSFSSHTSGTERVIWRLYILPDDVARGHIPRHDKTLRKALEGVLSSNLDVSSEIWSGHHNQNASQRFDPWAMSERCSLYFMFNTLPSPTPSSDYVRNRYSRRALDTLLRTNEPIRGLKTAPYAYQRRSAAAMVESETATRTQLDPRFESRTAPDGQTYYYNSRKSLFLRHARRYDSTRGGILAESMGYGKTLICIVAILATKGHLPHRPSQFAAPLHKPRERVGTLMDMAASTISQHSIAWRAVFDDIRATTGDEMTECVRALEECPPYYEIPPRTVRSSRSCSYSSPSERVDLCAGTIVVVPRNLVHQWRQEFEKHVEPGALRVLYMDQPNSLMPLPTILASYDVVLFSRTRFEKEVKSGDDLYVSPLSSHLWLRIIIDEGHDFSSGHSNAATVAHRIVRAERRWIVSGTPARDLLSIEADIAAMTDIAGEGMDAIRERSLLQRKDFDLQHETSSGAAKSIGQLAAKFLHVQPWDTYTCEEEVPAVWDDYIFRHESVRARTYACFSKCLRAVLESIVIKTRPEDIERDLELPPLSHEVVRLEPCFFDLLSANLFVNVFMANAITSERTDMDYLFHQSSQTHLHRLIANLRQSGFFWTGFNRESVEATIEVTRKYLAKKDQQCSTQDREMMRETMNEAEVAFSSRVWEHLSLTTEMGLVVDKWPAGSVKAWTFDKCDDPAVIGLTQCLQAQKFVHDSANVDGALDGLSAAGMTAKALMEAERIEDAEEQDDKKMVKLSVPASNFASDTMGSKRISVTGASKKATPKKTPNEAEASEVIATPAKSAHKRRLSFGETTLEIEPGSPLAQTRLTGTTSAKLTYLLDRVMELHQDEKILIFYDSGPMAYYLSQALDLLAVKHLIYANTLNGDQRSKYIVLFDTDPSYRVLVMDLKQAAHGLNLSSASRVFFVNPPFKPNVEAQAIKRAHRIGQTRPVRVETLILRGTVEEALQNRAASMSRKEHLAAANAIEQDDAIRHILQNARVIPLPEEMLRDGHAQMARLAVPQQIFGRLGRNSGTNVSRGEAALLEAALFGSDDEQRPVKRRRGPAGESPSTKKTPRTPKGGQRRGKISTPSHLPTPDLSPAVAASSLFGG